MITGRPRVAAIVLAAGASSRTAPAHKLLAPDATGLPMIARTLRAVAASQADPLIIAYGHRSADIHAAARRGIPPGRNPLFISARNHEAGLSRTLAAGIQLAGQHDVRGALICLGDMPCIAPSLLDRMIAVFTAHPDCPGVMPVHDGRRGNPILWNRSLFPTLMDQKGDKGARGLLDRYGAEMQQVEAGMEITEDFDTPARLAAFARMFAGG
ncbi:NTP transferase domain-containing protein [Komagataeibacter sp. FNDCF1]|uniref:nucleotidyltransferase family protein n=1 Tax=Komagataeibacter sp. FNDCF1 TaxID=2878681 RepID=UPI001E345E70|nr:nucleotidyltransferase family protein [Komagataeibacter sp. FNDCF1]MCE2565708.1 nucleotidyltransferase family protein [Komagataeibacter sp. FNDCF1]